MELYGAVPLRRIVCSVFRHELHAKIRSRHRVTFARTQHNDVITYFADGSLRFMRSLLSLHVLRTYLRTFLCALRTLRALRWMEGNPALATGRILWMCTPDSQHTVTKCIKSKPETYVLDDEIELIKR